METADTLAPSNTSMPSPADASASKNAADSSETVDTEHIPMPSNEISTISVEHVFMNILKHKRIDDRMEIYVHARQVYGAFEFSGECTFDELPAEKVELAVEELGKRLRMKYPLARHCEPWLARFLLWRRHELMTSTKPVPPPQSKNGHISAAEIFINFLDLPVRTERAIVNDVAYDIYKKANFNPILPYGSLPTFELEETTKVLQEALNKAHPPCRRCQPWLAPYLIRRLNKGRGRRERS